jgi:two-component system CheB/CheR fusion protein
MQSSNEELQSTNEELETSREELQSVNEELVTVNSELQQKIEELSRANNDMNNMLAGTGIGTLFVDQHLRIQRFTPAVTEILNLIPTDVGRPLADISPRLTGEADLIDSARSVLDTLVTVEAEVETSAGGCYQMRVLPYRTLENVIEGAVLTFVNVTERRRLQAERDKAIEAELEAGALAQSVLDSMREPRLVLDGALALVTVNQAFLATFGLARDALIGRPLTEIDGGAWRSPELAELLLRVLPEKTQISDFELDVTCGSKGPCTVTLEAYEALRPAGHGRRLIVLSVTRVEMRG